MRIPAVRSILVLLFLHLSAVSAFAVPQVWIESFTGMMGGESPQGYRYDVGAFGIDIQVNFRNDTFGTLDNQIVINGSPFGAGFSCFWDDIAGSGFCFGTLPYFCGKITFQARQDFFPIGVVLSKPVDIFAFNGPGCAGGGTLPRLSSSKLTCELSAAGKPVEVATGRLWHQTTDLSLSGPHGLRFARWYDSQTSYNKDLGFNWRHNYSAFLDLTLLPQRQVVLHDEEDRLTYFTNVAPGTTSYDHVSGSVLQLNGAGTVFTLATWNGSHFTFDSAGRLTSLSDRIGNTQTIVRDPANGFRITSVTDPLGRALNFGYDASNRITSITTTPPGLSLAFTYSGPNCPAGNLCSATMPDAKTWTYEYTDVGPHNLTKVLDPLGHAEEINGYSGGKVTSQSSEGGQNILNFAYPSGTTTTVTDGLSRVTTYTFDPRLLVATSIVGPGCGGGGESRTFTWDQFLRKTSDTDGLGVTHKITWAYNRDVKITRPGGFVEVVQAFPSPTSKTEPLSAGVNRVTSWTYYPLNDPRLDLVQTETIPSADTPGQSKVTTNNYSMNGLLLSRSEQGRIGGVVTTYMTSFTYDTKGRLLTRTGPRTDVMEITTSTYYPDSDSDLARRGQLQTITDAVGNVTTYAGAAAPFNTYDLYSHPRSITDPNGVVRQMTYDERGRLRISTLKGVPGDPADLTTTSDYDDAGRLTKVTLPLGNGTHYGYDGSNRLTDTIRFGADGKQYERLHIMPNVMGQKIQEDAQSCDTPAVSCAAWTTRRTDAFQYDSFARLWQVNHLDASTIFYTYDAAGNLKTVRDENHATPNTTYDYDFANRQKSVVQTLTGAPGNQITTLYAYDVHDNLNSVTDPNGNPTSSLYDDFRRRRQETSPVSGTTAYTYDPSNNLLTKTDANGSTTTRTYDAVNRALTAISTGTGLPTETVTFTYDDPTAGNFGLGRLASMSDPSGSASYAYERRGLLKSESRMIQGDPYSLGYGYDGNGSRSSVTYPSSRVVTYTFDFADRPASAISGGTSYVSTAFYRPFGPISQLDFGNGTRQTFMYDTRYRVTRNTLIKVSPLTTLADYVYTPDFVGNYTQIQDVVDPTYNRTFGYDDLNRLTTANSGASLWGTGSHAYDPMGNITALTLGATRVVTFAYDGTTPKLTSVTENGVPRAVGYDAVGNEAMVGAGTFTYSARNYVDTGDGLSYVYDGRGLRTVVTNSDVTPAKRYFFYTPELNLLAESELTTTTAPLIAFEYVWFNGRPVAQVDSGSVTHWIFADHLGTPVIQTDASAVIDWRVEYEPYGRVFALRTGDRHQPLRLPGQEAEQFDMGENGSTERFYNVFRWYRYGWGRYTQADPIGLRGGTNPYRYADGNPVRYIDPTGLVKWECTYAFISVSAPSGPGGGSIIANCVSECVNGRLLFVSISGYAAGVSLLSLPVGFSASNVTLEDRFLFPYASSLVGRVFYTAGSLIPGKGGSCGVLVLGFASSGLSCGGSTGLDFGFDFYLGLTGINAQHEAPCCSP